MINKIVNYLDELYPNPTSELNYTKDYEFLIAVMLSAHSTDKGVNKVTEVLFKKYRTLELLANADIEDIKQIIKPNGTYQRKASYIHSITNKLLNIGGFVPNDRKFLESLNGIGRKTTNVVLSELYGLECIAVDTHVTRVSIRLGLAKHNDNVLTIEKKLTEKFKSYSLKKLHNQLVLFGRYHCKAKMPECENCQLKDICKYRKKTKI